MDSCVSRHFLSDTTLTENPLGNVSPEEHHRIWQVNVAPGERVAILLEWEDGDDSAFQQALAEQGARMVREGDWVGSFNADSPYASNVKSLITCLNAATRYS